MSDIKKLHDFFDEYSVRIAKKEKWIDEQYHRRIFRNKIAAYIGGMIFLPSVIIFTISVFSFMSHDKFFNSHAPEAFPMAEEVFIAMGFSVVGIIIGKIMNTAPNSLRDRLEIEYQFQTLREIHSNKSL